MTSAPTWNWQQQDWPDFIYDFAKLRAREERFLLNAGIFLGAYKHIDDQEKLTFAIEVMSSEAVESSAIEGEQLNRDSVQSSIRRQLGLNTDQRRPKPAERGIAEMMIDLYQNFAPPLTHKTLFGWHRMITNGRMDIQTIGAYRTHEDAMQIVSGRIDTPKIHFEAPPSKTMKREMNRFIHWFNQTAPDGKAPLPALTRASIAHLYFVSVHPFEDGNGRIGRALVEKCIAQALGRPAVLGLSLMIHHQRKAYYDMLEASNKHNRIDPWLDYFSDVILKAQAHTSNLAEFLIAKAKFYDHHRGQLNVRQAKVIERMFREGPDGFKGGLSAEKYIAITSTSRATATRDLTELTNMKALTKTGSGKGTRYQLKWE
jgi:Fic family protein